MTYHTGSPLCAIGIGWPPVTTHRAAHAVATIVSRRVRLPIMLRTEKDWYKQEAVIITPIEWDTRRW